MDKNTQTVSTGSKEMEAIDKNQQIDITRLQEENKNQDLMFKVVFALSAVMIALFIILLAVLSGREIYCVHETCPHHIVEGLKNGK